jgi:hypothetical protein
LWSGCLGPVILFAGDILFYGEWGSARVWSHDYFLSMMAKVAPWRLHLGSIIGPVGVGFWLLGAVGLWYCCRRAAPWLAMGMLACMSIMKLLTLLQHGIFGPMGFAIRSCGHNSDAVAQIFKLNNLLTTLMTPFAYLYAAIWIFLTLRKKANVPRWTVLLAPLITNRLEKVAFWVPAPLGLPLWDGWSNVVMTLWFAVLALTYKDREKDIRSPQTTESPQAVSTSLQGNPT